MPCLSLYAMVYDWRGDNFEGEFSGGSDMTYYCTMTGKQKLLGIKSCAGYLAVTN